MQGDDIVIGTVGMIYVITNHQDFTRGTLT